MSGIPYWYFVPYKRNLQEALDELRDREFYAGRYNPVMRHIKFPINDKSPAPGPEHNTIFEALEASNEEGTRSILDISELSEEPEFCKAYPLGDDILMDLYGTTTPTRKQVESNMDFLSSIERGQAAYIIVYEQDRPTEVVFAGYSFD